MFWENQKGLHLHYLQTHFRMPVAHGMIFGPFRETHIPPSRWTQSQTLFAERWIIPYSTEKHWRLRDYSYGLGCHAGGPHRWLLECRWIKRFVWFWGSFHSVYFIGRKSSRQKYVVRGEINEETAYIQARSSMARALGENGKECQAEGEAKVV